MTKVIKLPTAKKQTPQPQRRTETRIMYLRTSGDTHLVNGRVPNLHRWISKNEKQISRAYNEYRNAERPIQPGEDIEDYKKTLPLFPCFEIEPDLYALMKAETKVEYLCIWIMLNSPHFPICSLVETGHVPDISANEIISKSLLD